jgi:hypothetical protein
VLFAAEGVHDTDIAATLDTSPALARRGEDGSPSCGVKRSRTNRARPPALFPTDAGRCREGGHLRASGPLWSAADGGHEDLPESCH